MRTASIFTAIAAADAARVDVEHKSVSVARHNYTFSENELLWTGDGSPLESWANEQNTPDCPARLRRSTCNDNAYKGIIAFFHGYSACSQQVESVSESLARECFDVVAPTYPGHGNAAVWCGPGGQSCDVQCGNQMGWQHETLPTERTSYHEFARGVHRALRQEKTYRATQTGTEADNLEINLVGLSFGAPVALDIALMGGKSTYAKMMLVNPYFALGDETIDQAKMDCEARARGGQGSIDECEREAVSAWLAPAGLDPDGSIASWLGSDSEEVTLNLFNNLVKLSDAVGGNFQGAGNSNEGTIGALMEDEQEWGSVCNQIWSQGRGGFCKFKKKHLLATHSFSLHTVVDAQQWGAWSWGVPATQIMMTERDGTTRNGISYAVAQHLHSIDSENVHACMHHFQPGTNRADANAYWSDANSMPHANLKGTRAGGRWWENRLFSRVQQFMTSGQDSGDGGHMGDRNHCRTLPLESGAEEGLHDLFDVGVTPTRQAQLWPGVLFRTLSFMSH